MEIQPFKNYDSCFKFFYNTEFNDTNWNDIQVPGHIQLQGFDNPTIQTLPTLGMGMTW